jgi:hypothetical protein
MASLDAHRESVRRNVALLDHLTTARLKEDPEWVATVAFYAAVHAVEAAFATDPGLSGQSRDHDERKHRLLNDPVYGRTLVHYTVLEKLSRDARYHAVLPGAPRFVNAGRALNAVQYQLIPLLDEVERITGETFPKPSLPSGPSSAPTP